MKPAQKKIEAPSANLAPKPLQQPAQQSAKKKTLFDES